MTGDSTTARDAALLRAGRRAWSLLGVLALAVLALLVVREVAVVAVPFVVALFPAAVLWPVASRLRGLGIPAALVALLLLLALFGVVGLALWFVIPRFLDELPALADSVQSAFSDLEAWLGDAPVPLPFDVGEGGLAGLAQQGFDALGGGVQGVLGQGVGLVAGVIDVVTGFLVFLVTLFFVLRDGERIWAGIASLLPAGVRDHAQAVSGQLWWTLGAYFRGQLLVALVDAVAIGIGLAVLGVPLVVPLALLVFFGGFFPIVGAFVSGSVAVLVALADGGPTTALLVLGLVIVVQQAEGNLLEPLILSPVLALHPFLIILSVTAGAVTYGVLGAFLAVPVAACVGRLVDYARGRRPAAGPGSDPDDDSPAWGGDEQDGGYADGDADRRRSSPSGGRAADDGPGDRAVERVGSREVRGE